MQVEAMEGLGSLKMKWKRPPRLSLAGWPQRGQPGAGKTPKPKLSENEKGIYESLIRRYKFK